jgi:hypothetical protein
VTVGRRVPLPRVQALKHWPRSAYQAACAVLPPSGAAAAASMCDAAAGKPAAWRGPLAREVHCRPWALRAAWSGAAAAARAG